MYWIVHVSGGPKRVNHSAVTIGDKIYSFGGYCSGDNYRIQRPIDVHILDTENLKWQVFYPPADLCKNAPFQRYGHTAVASGTKVYVWGGRNDEVACNNLYCFDTEHLEWSCIPTQGKKPGPRDGHSACVVNDHMYIFGGFEDFENQFSQEVYKLNLKTFVWSLVITEGEPPSYRDFHTATVIDNRMFVFGGRGDENAPQHSQMELYCNNIVYLDITTCRWHTPTTVGNPPIGRRSHSAFVYDGEIYIFGGYNSLNDTHFNDLYRFNPRTFCWQEIKPRGETPSKRRRQCCVVNGTRMYLFGGTSPVSENTDTLNLDEFIDQETTLYDHNDLHILELGMVTHNKKWKCESCLVDSSSTCSKTSDHGSTNAILEAINAFRKENNVKWEGNAETLNLVLTDINSIKVEVANIKVQFNEVRESFSETAESVTLLKEENIRLRVELNSAKKQLADLEQHSRKNNIIITGVPVTAKEDMTAILSAIAKSLEINFYSSDVSAAHRLQGRRGDAKPPSIVVCFVSRMVKSVWLAAKRKKRTLTARDISQSFSNTPVFLNEHLSPEVRAVFNSTRELVKQGKLSSVWTSDCCVMAKMTKEHRPFRVRDLQHVAELSIAILPTPYTSSTLTQTTTTQQSA